MAAPKKNDVPVLITLKPSECAQAILGMARSRKKRALFLWGQPGISKSAISQQVATELGVAFADIRLSQMDPTDLRGIPYPSNDGGVHGVAWSAPLVLPRDLDIEFVKDIPAIATVVRFYNPKGVNGIHYCTAPDIQVNAVDPTLRAEIVQPDPERRQFDRFAVRLVNSEGEPVAGQVQCIITGKVRAIVALEEFNSAPPSVQAAAYQLILDKRLGEYEVPEGVYLIAMGNRDTDKGVTFKMGTPIMNRFVHIEMHVDTPNWLDWAVGAGIHSHVLGYISHWTGELNQFNPGTAARGFPTPRTWEFVSDILYDNESTMQAQVLAGLLIGAVGQASAVKFLEHRRIAADLPKAEEILSGRLERMSKTVDIALAYTLTYTLCQTLLDEFKTMQRDTALLSKTYKSHENFDEWNERCDRFLGFIVRNFQPEIAIMGGKAALSTHKLPMDTQRMDNFEWFADKFRELILF